MYKPVVCYWLIVDVESWQPVIWSHGDLILTQNANVLAENISVDVEDGSEFRLTIHSVRVDQQGDYKCQVPGSTPIIQINRLVVFGKPTKFGLLVYTR